MKRTKNLILYSRYGIYQYNEDDFLFQFLFPPALTAWIQIKMD